jgi:hypothetical protein
VILLGVRKDIDPELGLRLVKKELEVKTGDVLSDLPTVRSGVTDRQDETWGKWCSVIEEG